MKTHHFFHNFQQSELELPLNMAVFTLMLLKSKESETRAALKCYFHPLLFLTTPDVGDFNLIVLKSLYMKTK